MLEMMLGKRPASAVIGDSGPGPKTLKYGTLDIGYFGEVSQSEMFTGPELANQMGLTAGIDTTSVGFYWWKFAYKGKILYIPSRQLRNYIGWNDLYAAGAVYGTKSNGAYPTAPAQWQHNPVVKAEGPVLWGFIPRLMTGWPNPTYPGTGLDAYPESSNSEWQQLVGRMCTYGNGNISEKWDAKTPDLLSVASTMSGWTQETLATDVTKANMRGNAFNAWAIVGSNSVTKTYNTGSDSLWRPVLELMPAGSLLNPQSAVLETAPIPQPPSIILARQPSGDVTEPVPIQNPVNVITSWPTKQPVIVDPAFTGSALNPTNVRGSANVGLNAFTITAAPSQLVGEPVNVVHSLADLNPFALTATASQLVGEPSNVLYSLADLNPFTISGVNIP